MPRGAFLSRLAIYELEGWNGEWFCLLEPLVYRDEDGRVYTAPDGAVTNFASVPRPLWSLFPRYGKHTRAAVIHDYLCATQGGVFHVPSVEAHAVFRRALRTCHVWTRWIWWLFVRVFGPRFAGA
ncbi:MAG: DUF1353 domain-containing protein [Gemmatimonadetes bacterium]|nr:DUF1353 domain-containing protein [Gemmatimonadota bacterium]